MGSEMCIRDSCSAIRLSVRESTTSDRRKEPTANFYLAEDVAFFDLRRLHVLEGASRDFVTSRPSLSRRSVRMIKRERLRATPFRKRSSGNIEFGFYLTQTPPVRKKKERAILLILCYLRSSLALCFRLVAHGCIISQYRTT